MSRRSVLTVAVTCLMGLSLPLQALAIGEPSFVSDSAVPGGVPIVAAGRAAPIGRGRRHNHQNEAHGETGIARPEVLGDRPWCRASEARREHGGDEAELSGPAGEPEGGTGCCVPLRQLSGSSARAKLRPPPAFHPVCGRWSRFPYHRYAGRLESEPWEVSS